MLNYNDPRGFDPFTTQAFSSGDEQQFSDRYFSAFPVNWRVQSSAHTLLLNEAGRLVYGGAVMEYALQAYTKTYGGAVMEYILGGIVEAEFTSAITITAPFDGLREMDAEFTSEITITAPFVGEVEVDAEFTSHIDFSSVFLPERTLEAEFTSHIVFTGEWATEDPGLDVWAFTLGADAPPPSRYTGFDFNSFAAIEGRYYAAAADGIYELTGDDDAGTAIDAYVLTARRGQGADRRSRMPMVYLAGRSQGVLHCAVIDEDGVEFDYTAERALGDRDGRERVKLGRGLKASFWQLKIGNENGEDFELTDAATLADILKRRVG